MRKGSEEKSVKKRAERRGKRELKA